jgi:hypothetical protein
MVWKIAEACIICTYELVIGALNMNVSKKVTTGLLLQLCSKEITKIGNMTIF